MEEEKGGRKGRRRIGKFPKRYKGVRSVGQPKLCMGCNSLDDLVFHDIRDFSPKVKSS